MSINTPVFVFAARPGEKVRVAGLFDDGPVGRLLEEPGGLRYAGWDLQTQDRARIVKGHYLEVKLADQKTIRLYEDGMLFARVPGDDSFLGWAASSDDRKPFAEKPRLNPLSLLEFTYNFVDLYRRVAEHLHPIPKTHGLFMSIRHTTVGEKKLYLNPYGLETWARLQDRTRYEAPEDSADLQVEVDATTLSDRPARAAYVLAEKVYLWFGVPINEIPYTTGAGEDRGLDVEFIRRGGK